MKLGGIDRRLTVLEERAGLGYSLHLRISFSGAPNGGEELRKRLN
jgi:hypothetical protein